MYKMIFKDLTDMTVIYEIGCEDLKVILNTTKFKSKMNMFTTTFDDYIDVVEDNKLSGEMLTFKMLILEHQAIRSFKKFLASHNRRILVEVTKGIAQPRYAIITPMELGNDEINDTDFYNFSFEALRRTQWIEIVSQQFSLDEQSQQVSNYADSDTLTDGYTYTDNFVYGGSNQTLESFRVNLPENDGDKYAYMQVIIDSASGPPAFGLNDNISNTLEGYKASDDLIVLPTQRLVLNSYKPFKRLILQSKVTGDIENVQKFRYFDKRTYIRVPQGENFLEFTNVTGGSVLLYKQYRLPY